MKHSYLRCCLFVLMILCGLLNLSAQITLHEATNVTQTKATLSADFPDLNSEHGFQYKYGTMPEIDDFSYCALAPQSDPISLSPNNWSARSNKGYVETYSGKSGVITAKVTLFQPSTLTFDWSIDAQEGCAYLRFLKNSVLASSSGVTYIEIARITGDTPFTTYSYNLGVGTHYLKWEYSQISPSSVGLDIGKIRNINIQNTQPGEWKNLATYDNKVNVLDLIPNSPILYRAYDNSDNNFTLSEIKSFNTLPVEIQEPRVLATTQTTVTISRSVGPCDSQLNKGVYFKPIDDLLATFVSDKTDCSGITVTNSSGWRVNADKIEYNVTTESGFSYGMLILNFEIGGEKYSRSKIEFDVTNDGAYHSGCYFGLFVDGEKNVKETFGKGSGHYVIELTQGKHTLEWQTKRWNNKAPGGTVTLSNLTIENIVSGNEYEKELMSDDVTIIRSLKPNHTYVVQSFVIPEGATSEPQAWQGECSEWFRVKTLPVNLTSDCNDTTQTSFNITGSVERGDALIQAIGVQYKVMTGKEWIDIPVDNSLSVFSIKATRLKPNNTYFYRCYAIPTECDTVYSEIHKITTKQVIAHKPEIIRLAQHEATLQGRVLFGDATIYQRGMQFRKKGTDNWEDVEDGGNDSIYTLVRKDLEMGVVYEARTYVQPAGCDIIYSDILEFTTLDTYFTICRNMSTQTTVTLEASLADLDEGITIDKYGFEYYIASDGFFENEENYVKSEVYDIPVVPNGKELKTTISDLCPSLGLKWRAYALVAGNKVYFTGSGNNEWNFAGTARATISVSVNKITQTSISLNLDATQDGGDAVISQIEYAPANSVNDTQEYTKCGNTLTINNLAPNKRYNIRFRGLVNGRYCPLLKEISWDYSWFEYQTLPVAVDVKFLDISQTKATMKVNVNSGDAIISNLRYRIDNGEILNCQESDLLTGLVPGQTYSVTIYANVNGEELSWNTNLSDELFRFTTKSVTSSVSVSDILQTSAKIKCSSNYGDATYLSSGLEFGGIIFNSEDQEFEKLITELLPGRTYSCRSFIDTEEGGRVYSSSRTFTTKSIECETLPVSNISNRSATMNGTIECDSYSSAEFGFQWKQMEGWESDPAFTKGRKLDDGTVSVALVNGMLEPNTDYQYRAAVRYQDQVYYASNWVTFRTESEFVYYPASVYTILRTDRENNALILCGYYVAGSETVISQGYEYWQTGSANNQTKSSQSSLIINTDESMQHEFEPGELPNGNYSVRAFVKTESGATIYGATLGFTSSASGYSGVDMIESGDPYIVTEGGVIKVYNANQLNCVIYSINGHVLANSMITDSYYEFRLTPGNFVIVTLSNGLTKKIKI